jgi:hypothetical protein
LSAASFRLWCDRLCGGFRELDKYKGRWTPSFSVVALQTQYAKFALQGLQSFSTKPPPIRLNIFKKNLKLLKNNKNQTTSTFLAI